MSDIRTTCPQCGAQGTAGRFCEYCGTKIPIPVIETKDDEDGDFNWYTVCPHDFEISFENVIGDCSQSLYMVVKTEMIEDHPLLGRGTVKYFSIINREGKFIAKKESTFLKLFTDNYDYITFRELTNIITKENFKFDDSFSTYACQIVGSLMISINSPRRIFNRKTRDFVQLDNNIPGTYELQEDKSTEERIILYDWDNGNESSNEPDRKCIITITDDKGIVTFEGNKKKVRELPPNAKIKEGGMCQVFDDVTIYRESNYRSYSLFDRKNEARISISKGPDYDYTFVERNSEGHFVFTKSKGSTEDVCTVRLVNSNGYLKAEASHEEREVKLSGADYLGCIIISVIVVLVVASFFIFVI